jgi:hypothetical protein
LFESLNPVPVNPSHLVGYDLTKQLLNPRLQRVHPLKFFTGEFRFQVPD